MEASRNSTLRQSDVIAVITEFDEMLRYRLAEGQTVVLDGIGRFSLRVESEGVDNPSKFRIKKPMYWRMADHAIQQLKRMK